MNKSDLHYIYEKDGKIKILSHSDALNTEENLLIEGWKHTSTYHLPSLLEYMFNNELDDPIKSFLNDNLIHNDDRINRKFQATLPNQQR